MAPSSQSHKTLFSILVEILGEIGLLETGDDVYKNHSRDILSTSISVEAGRHTEQYHVFDSVIHLKRHVVQKKCGKTEMQNLYICVTEN